MGENNIGENNIGENNTKNEFIIEKKSSDIDLL